MFSLRIHTRARLKSVLTGGWAENLRVPADFGRAPSLLTRPTRAADPRCYKDIGQICKLRPCKRVLDADCKRLVLGN